jgi:hypothetical protein
MWLPGTITVPMYRVSSMVSVSAANQIALIARIHSELSNIIFTDFNLGALLAANSPSCIKKDGSCKSEGHQTAAAKARCINRKIAIQLHVRRRQNTISLADTERKRTTGVLRTGPDNGPEFVAVGQNNVLVRVRARKALARHHPADHSANFYLK